MIKLFEFLNKSENKKNEWLPVGKHRVYLYDFQDEIIPMNLKEKIDINVITVTFKAHDSYKNAVGKIQIILDENYIEMAKNSTNAEYRWKNGAKALQVLISKTNLETINSKEDIIKALEQIKGDEQTLFSLSIRGTKYGVDQTLSY